MTGVRAAQEGVTLVELMVAIAIIGLMSSVALLTLAPSAPTLSDDAALFSRHMAIARRESVLRGEAVMVEIDDRGYRIMREASGTPLASFGWTAVRTARLGKGERLRFDASGIGGRYRLELGDDQDSIVLLGGISGLPVREGGDG